jgi:hypothetical protein
MPFTFSGTMPTAKEKAEAQQQAAKVAVEGGEALGMSPLESQARYGTQGFGGLTPQQAQAIITGYSGDVRGGDGGAYRDAIRVAQQIQSPFIERQRSLLQDYISDVKSRQAGTMFPSWIGRVQAQNLRNIRGALGDFYAMDPFAAGTAMSDRIVTNELGQVIGVYGEDGRLTGRDPARDERERRMQEGEGGAQQVVAPSPVTGQCPDGYIFDEDLQACRLDTGVAERVDYTAPQTYGMMGLLDTAPSGLLEFGERFRLPPVDFAASNQAFRRASGTIRQYPEYILL